MEAYFKGLKQSVIEVYNLLLKLLCEDLHMPPLMAKPMSVLRGGFSMDSSLHFSHISRARRGEDCPNL
jgi:hypothetical protein